MYAYVLMASLVLCTAATAQTIWDVSTQFSSTSSVSGQWGYGFGTRATVPGSYSFAVPGYFLGTFVNAKAGCQWLWDSTSKNSSNDPGPMVGETTATAVNWIFRIPPVAGVPDVYVLPVNWATGNPLGMVPIIRWTAPSAGTYSFFGTFTCPNSGHWSKYWIVKRAATGIYTTITTSPIVSTSPYTVYGSQALDSGDCLDFIVDVTSNLRAYTRIDMKVSAGDVPGVNGYVRDSLGNAIAGATVTNGTQSTTTGTDGTYTLVVPISGTYTITASKPAYITQATANVAVATSGMVPVNFTLADGNTISGTVRANLGSNPALAGASVQTTDMVYQTTADSAGNYSLRVTPGTHSLFYNKLGFLPKTISVDASAGNASQTADLNLGWDFATDFGTVRNPGPNVDPRGPWQYGWVDGGGFHIDTATYSNYPVGATSPALIGWNRYANYYNPSIYKNVTLAPTTIQHAQQMPYIPSWKVAITGGITGGWGSITNALGDGAVARLAALQGGYYKLDVRFGSACYATGANAAHVAVSVVKNGTAVLGDVPSSGSAVYVDGFQGRSAVGFTDSFSTASPVRTYSSTLDVAAGDTIDGIVYYNPSTNLSLGRYVQVDMSLSAAADAAFIYGSVKCANLPGNPGIYSAVVTATGGGYTYQGVTDAYGNYFISARPGTYSLSVVEEGYVQTSCTAPTVAVEAAGNAAQSDFVMTGNFANSVADLKGFAVGTGVKILTPLQLGSAVLKSGMSGQVLGFDKPYNGTTMPMDPEYSFYVQSDDRLQGMKCVSNGLQTYRDPSYKVTFTGTIALDPATGQKFVQVSSVDSAVQNASAAMPTPIGKGSKGFAANGALVKVWGKITQLVPNTLTVPEDDGNGHLKWSYEYIVINDGGTDIKVATHTQFNWVSTVDPSVAALSVGDYIAVTGIAGTTNGTDLAVFPRNYAEIYNYNDIGM